jgi:hypothetical protein
LFSSQSRTEIIGQASNLKVNDGQKFLWGAQEEEMTATQVVKEKAPKFQQIIK